MSIIPFHKQTLVSSFSKDEVLTMIRSKTRLISDDHSIKNPVFNGHVDKNGFRLSATVTYSQNALPLVVGTVEDTSRGSIVFLHLRLFPAALLYLIAFSGMAIFIGTVLLILSKSIVGPVISITLALANYLILNINFHRKATETIQEFETILSDLD